MKKRTATSIFIILLIIISCFSFFINEINYVKDFSATEEAEDFQILKEVSSRTGENFSSMDSLRKYVYCNLLSKGMSFEEIRNSLSIVGELVNSNVSPDTQVRFANNVLDRNFGAIVLDYDIETGKLINWRNSTTHNYDISCTESH